jgi:hypothetical protein
MAGQQAFNPDSSGYDMETAKELMELYPLTVPKPNRSGRFDRETISQDDAFQAWVWHGEENDWVKHGGTLDPRTGMYLKGMAKNSQKDSEAYKSMRLGIEEEERRGNKVIFKDGRYYSVPSLTEQPTSKSIDDIINSANIAEFISGTQTDKTNVDTSTKDIKQLLPGRKDTDMFMQTMFPDIYEQYKRSMLEKKLIDLAKEKPSKM